MTEFNLGLVAIAVIGFSQWLKEKMKVDGQRAELLSFVVGVVAGGTYQIAIYQPTKAQDIFGAVLVALLMGLVPSGLYKFTGALAEKVRPSYTITGSPAVELQDKRVSEFLKSHRQG